MTKPIVAALALVAVVPALGDDKAGPAVEGSG